MSEDLRYPIGEFDAETPVGEGDTGRHIRVIGELPERLAEAVAGLDEEQLDTRYRPGGWTVRQVVHHVADSHINALCRFKLALTEEQPTIRPYEEARWAELADCRMAVGVSLELLRAVHSRWVVLLNSLGAEELRRKLNHPESGIWTLERFLALYAWHSEHHTAHITSLRKRENW